MHLDRNEGQSKKTKPNHPDGDREYGKVLAGIRTRMTARNQRGAESFPNRKEDAAAHEGQAGQACKSPIADPLAVAVWQWGFPIRPGSVLSGP